MTKPFVLSCSRRFLLPLMTGALLINGLPNQKALIAQEAPAAVASQAQAAPTGVEIQQELRRFRELGSVLYVAAHPDDENTQLITYLARGRGYRTAYLSLTRGDGGQNVLGGEFGAELGAIRTQELLAARRLDGARQYFSRALDFGFSKDYKETLRIWDHQQVLADVVRVIRTFRPDVIITRFSPEPGGTHGHHTASAVLAIEAFKLAGDPNAFPEQLGQLKPWQPKRILQNGRGGGGLQLDINGTDSVSGESFARIAGRSRGMHKSQGFGGFTGGNESRPENFQLLGGDAATKDILDGVDTSWNRLTGDAEIDRLAKEVSDNFDPNDPAASVPALLQLRARLTALPTGDTVVEEKRRDLDKILKECLGLQVETILLQDRVVPGETVKLRHTARVTDRVGAAVPVRWLGIEYPDGGAPIDNVSNNATKNAIELQPGQFAAREATQTVPEQTPLSQPYWLRHEPKAGISVVDDPQIIGQPENTPPFRVKNIFEVSGQRLEVLDVPVQRQTVTSRFSTTGPMRQALEVIAPVALRPLTDVRLFAPGATRPVAVEVTAWRDNVAGSLRLEVPAGWKVEPALQPFNLTSAGNRLRVGDSMVLTFTVTAPAQAASGNITAQATVNGKTYETGRREIKYPHIPPLLLQPAARLKAVALDLKTKGQEIGYLPGAGDSVAAALEEMGHKVTLLSGADLTLEKLRRFDAVVIGVRAFNVRDDLAANMPALFAYVENGGNVIAQYNRPDGLKTNKIAPFDLTLSGQRVTDETAAVTFLAPEHPALNMPNKITPADFEGWVQERGIYFPNQWDAQFTPLLAMNDPGEEPLKGSLLVAPYGKGHFVYTGLVFFRQLPAGVPGAYRLMANLVALGK